MERVIIGGLTLTGGTLTPTSLVPTAAYTQTGNTNGVWGVTVGISGADKLVPTGVAKAASNGTTASEPTGWDALSNGAKYGIYGGAAAVGILIIVCSPGRTVISVRELTLHDRP